MDLHDGRSARRAKLGRVFPKPSRGIRNLVPMYPAYQRLSEPDLRSIRDVQGAKGIRALIFPTGLRRDDHVQCYRQRHFRLWDAEAHTKQYWPKSASMSAKHNRRSHHLPYSVTVETTD